MAGPFAKLKIFFVKNYTHLINKRKNGSLWDNFIGLKYVGSATFSQLFNEIIFY